jgi:hypothetical protein
MASKYVFLTGKAYWAKIKKPDLDYQKYSIDIYLDEPSMEKFDDSGIKVQKKINDLGTYVRFSRKMSEVFKGEVKEMGPPSTLIFKDGEYKPFDDYIGNGSFVTVKVQVYDTQKGKGHRLEAVAVENLVPYEQHADEDMPF